MAREESGVLTSSDDVDAERVSFVRELSTVGTELDEGVVPRLEPFPSEEESPQSRPRVRAADSIVESLVALGVDTFFGVPGGPISPIFDAILNCPGARLIESRRETGAAFAALRRRRHQVEALFDFAMRSDELPRSTVGSL